MAEAKQVDFLVAGIRHPLTDEPLAGGLVYTYAAGTSTLANLYVDRDTAEGETTNPVVLDSFGRAEVFGNGVYRFVIKDAAEAETILEMDNMEYYAAISDTAIPTLTADLDFGGHKGINLIPGTESGDTVEYAQFTDAIDGLDTDIEALETVVADQEFVDLTDTPPTLTGMGGKVVTVNAGGTALEFLTPAQFLATASFLSLSDTPSAFTGQAGKAPVVNTGETALEFGYSDARTLYGIPISSTASSSSPPANGQVLAYNSSTEQYEPVNQTSVPTIATLTPGTGLSGDAYDGSADVTWAVSGVSGVTVVHVAGASYTASSGKTIIAAAVISTAGAIAPFFIPNAEVNAGVLSHSMYDVPECVNYATCTYTVGDGNSVVLAMAGCGNPVVSRIVVFLGDA